jgi:hypothetical protein
VLVFWQELDAALNPGWTVDDIERQRLTPDPYRPGEYLVREVDGVWVERVPTFEAVATRGEGVMETLESISQMVMDALRGLRANP